MRKPVRPRAMATLLGALGLLLYVVLAAVFHLPVGWVIVIVVPLIALTLLATVLRSRRDRGRPGRGSRR